MTEGNEIALYSLKQNQSIQIRREDSIKAPTSVPYYFLENKFFAATLQLHKTVNMPSDVQVKSTSIIQGCFIFIQRHFIIRDNNCNFSFFRQSNLTSYGRIPKNIPLCLKLILSI